MEQMILRKLKYLVAVEYEEDDYGWGGPGGDEEREGWGKEEEREYYFSRDDIRQFADLLGKMFKWKPEDRAGLEENHGVPLV